jgi:hypothetical protein
MEARVAIYYAPLPDDPLTSLSSSWLGRDPRSGEPVRHPDLDGIAEVTAEPRMYGFHATLKPPMRLRRAFWRCGKRRRAVRYRHWPMPAWNISIPSA